MWSFSEWVVITEGMPDPSLRMGGYNHTRDQQRSLQGPDAKRAQVAFGLSQEAKIRDALAQQGINVEPTRNPAVDKFQKIDGWWLNGFRRDPVQIKYRDTGNDLLFEVIRQNGPITSPLLGPNNRLGRDVKPPDAPANKFNPNLNRGPKYIFFLNQGGTTLSIIESASCYTFIGDMLQQIDTKGWTNPERKTYTSAEGVMRYQIDQSNGKHKIMAYIPLRNCKVLKQVNVSVNIS